MCTPPSQGPSEGDGDEGSDDSGSDAPSISAFTGTWTYKSMIECGALSEDGKQGLGGYRRYWDEASGTPFLFNERSKLLMRFSVWWSHADTLCFRTNPYPLRGFAVCSAQDRVCTRHGFGGHVGSVSVTKATASNSAHSVMCSQCHLCLPGLQSTGIVCGKKWFPVTVANRAFRLLAVQWLRCLCVGNL